METRKLAKHIARQLSCHKFIVHDRGSAEDQVNIFLSSSLISPCKICTMLKIHHAHTMCAHVGRPKNWQDAGAPPLGIGRV